MLLDSEFQIGPCVGIEEGDHLWMARYLLQRVAEKHGVVVNWAKPVRVTGMVRVVILITALRISEGNEVKTGLEFIEEAIEKLSLKQKNTSESIWNWYEEEYRRTRNRVL